MGLLCARGFAKVWPRKADEPDGGSVGLFAGHQTTDN